MGQSANSSLAKKIDQTLFILPHSFTVNQFPQANIFLLFVIYYLLFAAQSVLANN